MQTTHYFAQLLLRLVHKMNQNKIFIFPETKTEYKDKLYRIPVMVMRIFLLLSFIFYGYHKATSSVLSVSYLFGNLNISYPIAIVIGQFISAGISLVVFEIVAKFYYGFIRPFSIYTKVTQKIFMTYLRASYFIRNILGGLVKFLVFKSDFDVFCYDSIIGFLVTVIVLIATCVYVTCKYVPIKARAGFVRAVSLPFIVYEVITWGIALI